MAEFDLIALIRSRAAASAGSMPGSGEGVVLVGEGFARCFHAGTDFLREGGERNIAFLLILHHLFQRGRYCGALGREHALPHLL